MRTLLLLFTIGISFSPLSAENYKIEKIGIEQGLSNNYIVSITQDKEGFIWFATESGLNRFDGKIFTVFKKELPTRNTINSNELNKILADRNDKIIWIATQRTGLNAYDYHSHTFYHYTSTPNTPDNIISNDITDLAMSADGNLWLSTYYNGVDLLNRKTKKFTHYNGATISGMVSNMIWCIADDQKGNLYMGHVKNGLSVLSVKAKRIKNYIHDDADPNSLPSNTIKSIYIDKTGKVWIGTSDGLALFNPATEKFTVFKSRFSSNPKVSRQNTIFSITGLNDGKLLIGTENEGLKILNPQQTSAGALFDNILAKDDETGLSSPSVMSVMQDSYGNIWMGTYGGGINFISNKPEFFKTWTYSSIRGTEKNCLSSRTAWGMCTDEKGRLWIGTERGGIDVFENEKKIKNYKTEPEGIPNDIIYSAIKDSEGNLWFGTYCGILCYTTRTGHFKKIIPELIGKIGVRCLYEDRSKNIWIGTNDGIFVYNLLSKKSRNYNTKNSKLPDNLVRSICQDSVGNMWIGTLGEGLTIFSTQFRYIRSFNKRNGFCSNGITYIYKDSKKRMWVATREGLVRFNSCKDNLYKVYRVKDGLADSYIHAIIESMSGDIWISTNRGLSCFHLKNQQFLNYDHNDGLPIGVFKDGSVMKDSRGTIYFGSQNGICYFNPLSELIFGLSPPVITDFKIYNKHVAQTSYETSIPVSEPILLNYNQNTFSISFNVLDYALNKKIEFTYSLKGLDKAWYPLKNENEVTFRNIPPGKYVFLIKARIRNNPWVNNPTALYFTIKPPFWLTWWAKLFYTVLLIGITFFIFLFYKKKIYLENALLWEKRSHQQEHELNNEKLNFYTNIAHELRTPLTLILGPLEDLSHKELTQENNKKVSLIYQSAKRLLQLINQILEFRNTESHNRKLRLTYGDLSGLVTEIGLKYKELNQNHSISFKINIESPGLMLYFDPEIITIVLDNLISNAIKNTEKGEIILSLRNISKENNLYTEIEISDTGYGIPTNDLQKIFDRFYRVKDGRQVSGSGIGLALVKNLVELHQGRITVNSIPGKGSSFYFQLITKNTYPDVLNGKENLVEKSTIPLIEDKVAAVDKSVILVIEDNKDILEYIAGTFIESFEILKAENGEVGLNMAIAHTPDLIISDVMMPLMNGFELCKTLKTDIRTSHIPVILLTAKDSLHDKADGYACGADSYITKPFSTNLIRNRVDNLLNTRKKLAELFANSIGQKRAKVAESISRLDNEFIEKLTAIIEDHLQSEDINVIAIADQMSMSYSSLYRKVKALSGLSANEFIRKIKLKNAETLLLTGKYSISEVAFKIGINSVKYFRQCFKDEYGVTPSEYIHKLKSK